MLFFESVEALRSYQRLTARQREYVEAIARFTRGNGYTPTFRDLKRAFGLASTNGVHDVLKRLRRAGVVVPRAVPSESRLLALRGISWRPVTAAHAATV